MKVCRHAVRRYKKRLGNKSASKQRIVKKINKEMEERAIRKYTKNNHLFIETERFTAVCYKNTVITILLPQEEYEGAS